MKRLASLLVAFFVAFGAAGAAHAQTDGDLALLTSGAGVPPNVMIVLDSSGSMQHIIWHDDFDTQVFWDNNAFTPDCWRKPISGGSWTKFGVSVQGGTAGMCPGSGDPGDACPNNSSNFTVRDSEGGHYVACPSTHFGTPCGGLPATQCFEASGWTYLILDDLEGTFANTRWARNYAHWYALQLMQGTLASPIPQQTRNQGAKQAIQTLVDDTNPDDPNEPLGYIENVRFGLGRFKGNNGGYVVEPIASGNKTTFMTSLANIVPGGNTPLSETLVDIGRYFTGEHQNLGDYPRYNFNTSNGSTTSSPPSSPIDPTLECQTNFVILMTDGVPVNDANDHYGSDFTNTIGDFDADGNDPGTVYSDWLDDVAAYLYQTDLIDDATAPGTQNIVTYTVGFTIDLPLLQDAATNGGGSYFTTSNASVLAAQLKQAIVSIIERSTSFSAASVPASNSAFGNGFFAAYFRPSAAEPFWEGHLEAYRLSENLEILGQGGANAIDPSTGQFVDPRIPLWDAGHELAGTNGADVHPPRNLFTTKLGVRTTFDAATMTSLDLDIQPADMTAYPGGPYASQEALADTIVNFFVGQDAFDTDGDLDISELREKVLGDIFHSNPQVVATPPPFLLGEEGFGPATDPLTFFGRYALRDRRLYVGANDGMFHGFKAGHLVFADDPETPTVTEIAYYDLMETAIGGTGGEEAFGWVPGFLQPKLKELPLQNINNKKYYVDGSPMIADAWLPADGTDVNKDSAEWTTVSMVGMRRGGDGYLVLDVTDPNAGPTDDHGPYPKLMFEFADPAQPLGETWSQPVISRVRVDDGPGGDYCDSGVASPPIPNCRETWVAIFAGGYRESGDAVLPSYIADPLDAAWDDDSKALFMVELATGQVLAKLEYDAADPQLQNMKFSMPSTPAVLDTDFDGYVDLIYVGDTGGQVWKWDVSEIGVRDMTGVVTSWTYGRFFAAPVAANGHYRSIFHAPVAALVDGKLTLAFGTGERTDLTYKTGQGGVDDNNRFYVIEDPNPVGASSIPAAPYTESDISKLNGNFEDPIKTDLGYYLIAEPNEKFVTAHIAFAGFIITASYEPDLGTGNACTSGEGEAFLHIFEIDDGGGFFPDDGSGPLSTRRLALGAGLPTDPRITTSGGGNKIFIQTSGGAVVSTDAPDDDDEDVGIVFWRQQL